MIFIGQNNNYFTDCAFKMVYQKYIAIFYANSTPQKRLVKLGKWDLGSVIKKNVVRLRYLTKIIFKKKSALMRGELGSVADRKRHYFYKRPQCG